MNKKAHTKISNGTILSILGAVLGIFVILAVCGVFTGLSLFQLIPDSYEKQGTWKEINYTAHSTAPFDSYSYRVENVNEKYPDGQYNWRVNVKADSQSAFNGGVSYSVSRAKNTGFERSDQLCIVFDSVEMNDVDSFALLGKIKLDGILYKSSSKPNLNIGLLEDGSPISLLDTSGKNVEIDGHNEQFTFTLVNPKITNAGNLFILTDYNQEVIGELDRKPGSKYRPYICTTGIFANSRTGGSSIVTDFSFSDYALAKKTSSAPIAQSPARVEAPEASSTTPEPVAKEKQTWLEKLVAFLKWIRGD